MYMEKQVVERIFQNELAPMRKDIGMGRSGDAALFTSARRGLDAASERGHSSCQHLLHSRQPKTSSGWQYCIRTGLLVTPQQPASRIEAICAQIAEA
jgi:hypothetical protein